MTKFIGISFGSVSNRVCAIATSEGLGIVQSEGMSTREVVAFLWALSQKLNRRKAAEKIAFVVYDAAVDFEMILQDLNQWDKDRLFGIWRKKEDENKDLPIYDGGRGAEIVDYEGLRLGYISGKIFRLSKSGRKGMAIYDISSYFDSDEIGAVAGEYLGEDAPPRVERNDLSLWSDAIIENLLLRCEVEAKLIARLAAKVEEVAAGADITPRQWYGPSSIASRCLNKWRARGQAKRLTDKNTASELLTAIDRAYFGGRVEACKLGTIKDVRLFDLNSAYALATTLLSQFYHPLRFTRQVDLSQPFSCWLVEYEIPKSATLGPLPARAPQGGISFRRKGKGYFWQPEVDYIAKTYPGCFEIRHGYAYKNYEPVEFASDIHNLYDYRLQLKADGDAGQKIIKLALSNLYGKFAQNIGGAYYQCRAWAGWITSYIRRLLLDAVTGIEDKVICFSQDAVHLEGAEARVPLGEGLGEWKRNEYAEGLYLAPGIYDLQETAIKAAGGPNKKATRGANLNLDFQRIGRELSERQVSELRRTFFVGWALARNADIKYGPDYLKDISETITLMPNRMKARNYSASFNWLKESKESKINEQFSGLISSRYIPQDSTNCLRLRLKDQGWS